MKLLNLGTILKQKGLDGTVKVYSSTDFAEIRYQKGNKVFLHNEKDGKLIEVTVKAFYSAQGFDFVTFEEYTTFEAIAPFLQWKIVVDKDTLPPLEDGMYYYCDLIDSKVVDKEKGEIGVCKSVEDFNGRRSLRVTLKNKKEILIPYYPFVKTVDVDNKIINVELIKGMVD